jgi:hypothetical protein
MKAATVGRRSHKRAGEARLDIPGREAFRRTPAPAPASRPRGRRRMRALSSSRTTPPPAPQLPSFTSLMITQVSIRVRSFVRQVLRLEGGGRNLLDHQLLALVRERALRNRYVDERHGLAPVWVGCFTQRTLNG